MSDNQPLSGKIPSRPNIILVLMDDLGWGDLSCYGNPDADTPHIDTLAREGVAFEQFYSNSPICSPSRVAFSSGTYPQRWGITSYLCSRASNEERGMAQWLDPGAPMLARRLQEAGYATGHFGKWHMGGQRDVAEAPPISEYGFDESLCNFEGIGAKLLPLTMEPDGTVGRIWEHGEILGEPFTWMQRSEITGGFVEAAIDFMNRAREAEKPFYINVWPDDVHSPYWPSIGGWGDGSRSRKYLSVVEEMDAQLAALFDAVKSNPQLRDNTLILFSSDHGPEPRDGQVTPFKGYKTHLYEGGIRSPLIVWGPGLVAPAAVGTRNRTSVFAAMDLVPSLARLCGVSKPEDADFDGQDLLEVVLGHSDTSREEPIFFSRPPDRKSFYGFENLPDLAVRCGPWKLLCDYDGGRPELYDLATDPGEETNLAGMQPKTARELVSSVVGWWNSV